MKFKMNIRTMTPHDAAKRFFPEFSRFVIKVGEKEVGGHCVLDLDDKGRAVLSFEDGRQDMQAREPVMEVGRVFRR